VKENSVKYQENLEFVNCNLCEADDYEVVIPPKYDLAQPQNIVASFRSSGDEILIDQLVRCRQCGLLYLNPRLNQKIVEESYSSGTDELFVSQNEARERTFTKSLDQIKQIVPQQGRILDVGTAGGTFLGVAKQQGWEVAGCEPNKWLAEWGSKKYGIEIKAGTIFDMRLHDAFFDVVTLWDVLEHTADPQKVLAECNRVLKNNGILVVNYPDIKALVSRLMGKKWVFLLSVHLYYFTFETLKPMLEKNGFKIVVRKNYWQRLELDYILFRMEKYLPVLPAFGRKIISFLRIKNLQIPYWLGQILILAQKTGNE